LRSISRGCYYLGMEPILRYRGRPVSDSDVDFIRRLLATSPQVSRRALSIQLCEAWNWRQPNGEPSDAVCRGLLLALHRAGHIELPAPKWRSQKPRVRCIPPPVDDVATTLLGCRLGELGLLDIRQVRRTPDEAKVIGLIERYHYLGYVQPVGESLKYLVSAGGRPIACFAWSSAPRHLGPRDRFIGWSKEARRANIRQVAYQSRFLILPWVQVPHLASHLLGRMARRLSSDWEQVYAHGIDFTETFVDPARYRGTCYRAANWQYLGMTTGRGKDARTREPTRSRKMVFGYPLVADFRERLGRLT